MFSGDCPSNTSKRVFTLLLHKSKSLESTVVSSGYDIFEKIELSYPIIESSLGTEILFCFANFNAVIARKSSEAIIPSGEKNLW